MKNIINQTINLYIHGGIKMTIAEVSKKYDLTPDTLRYYERIGLLVNIPRNSMEYEIMMKTLAKEQNL